MFRSAGSGLDGRATVEIQDAVYAASTLRLFGNASVYEGNLLIGIDYGARGPVEWLSVQVTVGAPSRGPWSAEVSVSALPAIAIIGEDDAKAGGISVASTVRLLMNTDGKVSRVGNDELV
jgi:hypothetical protein